MGKKKKLKSTKKINRSLLRSFLLFAIVAGIALYIILNRGKVFGRSLVEVSTDAVTKVEEIKHSLDITCDKEYLAAPSKSREADTAKITVIYDGEPTSENVTFTSSDEEVVTVSEDGTITAVDLGMATVKAQIGSLNQEVTVFVIEPIQDMKLTITSSSIRVGKELQLKLVTTPTGASMDTITWESEDESIATVNPNGICTGVSAGKVNITAKDSYTGIEKTIAVTIRN